MWPSSLWRHVKQPAGDDDGDAVVKDDDGDDAEEDDGDDDGDADVEEDKDENDFQNLARYQQADDNNFSIEGQFPSLKIINIFAGETRASFHMGRQPGCYEIPIQKGLVLSSAIPLIAKR